MNQYQRGANKGRSFVQRGKFYRTNWYVLRLTIRSSKKSEKQELLISLLSPVYENGPISSCRLARFNGAGHFTVRKRCRYWTDFTRIT
jgi:hypothetical protein